MTTPNEALRLALDACRHKLTLYRNAHSGEYIGGIEYTALIKMIDAAIALPVQPTIQHWPMETQPDGTTNPVDPADMEVEPTAQPLTNCRRDKIINGIGLGNCGCLEVCKHAAIAAGGGKS